MTDYEIATEAARDAREQASRASDDGKRKTWERWMKREEMWIEGKTKVKFKNTDLGAWTGTVTDVSQIRHGVVYVSWDDGSGAAPRVRKESTVNIRLTQEEA